MSEQIVQPANAIQDEANKYIVKLLKESGKCIEDLTPQEKALFALVIIKMGANNG